MIMPERICILKPVLVLTLLATGTTHADQIPAGYREVAQQYAIPPAVFYAIAKTESAKRIKRGGNSIPVVKLWTWRTVKNDPKTGFVQVIACCSFSD